METKRKVKFYQHCANPKKSPNHKGNKKGFSQTNKPPPSKSQINQVVPATKPLPTNKSLAKTNGSTSTISLTPVITALATTQLTPNVSPSLSEISTQRSLEKNITVDEMTSRDFQLDINAHIDVTAQLLKDQSCVRNFQLAISMNKHLFRNKIVLDIGCGTGILSLFAAKAGAARVFAVDPSQVVDYTRKIVVANKYEDIIEVIQGRVEEINLPVKQIDIIVCDWMGYSLLYQSTCEAVIYARDKWLRNDGSGLIFPDIAKLYIAGFVDAEQKNDKIEWWKNVYGFNMKCLRECAIKEPSFYAVHPQQIITSDYNVMTINLNTATLKELRCRCLLTLRVWRSDLMDGIVTYFKVHFSKSHTPIMFSTDPLAPQTHWMQTVLFFDQPLSVKVDEIICGGFEIVPANRKEPDFNDIAVALELCSSEPVQLQVDMHWRMKPHAACTTKKQKASESETDSPSSSSSSESPPPPTVHKSGDGKISDSSTDSQSSPFLAALLQKNVNKNSGGMKENMRKKK